MVCVTLIAEHLIGIFKNVLLKSHSLGRKKKMMPEAQHLYIHVSDQTSETEFQVK